MSVGVATGSAKENPGVFCWGLCGYKVFLSGLRNCPCQGPCPSKVFRGFAFGGLPYSARQQGPQVGPLGVKPRHGMPA